jgi:hypothetical protein
MSWTTTDWSTRSETSLAPLARDFWWNGYVVMEGLIPRDLVAEVRREIDTLFEDEFNRRAGKVQDAWEIQRATREIATGAPLRDILRYFYGRRPIPHQTLSYLQGSGLRLHTDSWHAGTMPPGFVCSAWTAIDEAEADNGPLFCYPGSHHLDELTPRDVASDFDRLDVCAQVLEPLDKGPYQDLQQARMQDGGYERHEFHVHPGDVVLFAGNLLHGGSPIANPEKTRRSIVTQFVFDGCVYYTPRFSDVPTNQIALRDALVDITSGQRVKQSYNGRRVAYHQLKGDISALYVEPSLRQLASAFVHEARAHFPHRRARKHRAEERRRRQELGQSLRRNKDGGNQRTGWPP